MAAAWPRWRGRGAVGVSSSGLVWMSLLRPCVLPFRNEGGAGAQLAGCRHSRPVGRPWSHRRRPHRARPGAPVVAAARLASGAGYQADRWDHPPPNGHVAVAPAVAAATVSTSVAASPCATANGKLDGERGWLPHPPPAPVFPALGRHRRPPNSPPRAAPAVPCCKAAATGCVNVARPRLSYFPVPHPAARGPHSVGHLRPCGCGRRPSPPPPSWGRRAAPLPPPHLVTITDKKTLRAGGT